MLRKHIDELRSSRPVDTRILYELGNIDGYLANHLRSVSRYDEARTLMRERIDFLSDCMRKDEASEEYAWVMTRSLYESGVLERETLSYDEALEYLDRAARLILDAPRAGGPRESQAMPLAVEYSRLREEFELSGDGERSARAGRGRRRMLDLILAAESDRPDRVLFKACALADDGDEGRARELVDGLAARDRPFESQPGWVRQTTAEALREWGWREARRFVPRGRDEPEVRPDDPSVDQFLGRFARLCDRFGADARDLNELADGVLDPACRAASRQRQAGRLDLAEKTVAFLSALGAATVRSRPDLPVSHILLAESHEQRSKNAWKRDDVAGVRDELASAVKVVQEALHLAPDDWRLIARLKTYTRKLSGLPPQEGSHLAAGPDGGANPGPSSR